MEIEDKKVIEALEGFDALAGLILLFAVILPLQAFVFLKGWQWFIGPLSGVAINYFQALGIFTLTRFATLSGTNCKQDESKTLTGRSIHTIIYTAVVLGMMYLAVTLSQ